MRGQGCDHLDTWELIRDPGYKVHIMTGGQGSKDGSTIPGSRSRHYMVERMHSGSSVFSRLLIRREKRKEDYLAFLHFAFAWVTFRAADIVG
ncbi:MAG: hypothetical protein NZ700_09005 [Gemmataceae bacterium]|nr:hypothetical protein [Gemmataceae bacterium]MDW8267382.1 hypothetical protein [Gemmataceae bacterium]